MSKNTKKSATRIKKKKLIVNCIGKQGMNVLILRFRIQEVKGGTVASHQCMALVQVLALMICALSLSFVFVLVSGGFSPGTPVFCSPQKPTLPISI